MPRPNPGREQKPDEPILREEFERKFKALERRMSRVEREKKALEKQLQKFTSVKGDRVDVGELNPDIFATLNIIESLQGEKGTASMEAVKKEAKHRGMLKSQVKVYVNRLIEQCHVEGEVDGRVRVVSWPEEDVDE